MLRINHPDGTSETFTYNELGQVLTHTDGKGQTTQLLRNGRGLPKWRQDAKGQTITYEYDKAIRLEPSRSIRTACVIRVRAIWPCQWP
ncbi:YD repeat-containing protein [Pseudomonas amygdali pv. tabaci]|nr:YD repeat-containing protein [Pseudomonas amygdali pv. tabaci]